MRTLASERQRFDNRRQDQAAALDQPRLCRQAVRFGQPVPQIGIAPQLGGDARQRVARAHRIAAGAARLGIAVKALDRLAKIGIAHSAAAGAVPEQPGIGRADIRARRRTILDRLVVTDLHRAIIARKTISING